MELIQLATLYRVINLYTHHAHNLTKGATFIPDHNLFNDIYSAADGYYDDVIERYIGTNDDNINLLTILAETQKILSKTDQNFLKTTLTLLQHSISKLDTLCKSPTLSQGTINLLQGQADSIEVFIYKLKRRLCD
jgi:DNA-binding ferritin-like protein